jgi:methylenetetrahydrofolate dehydrogenase (NADP+)/methenyltetrahydrofolate cyclohydrolase
MAKVLKGSLVTAAINAELSQRIEKLRDKGVTPCLAIVRVGERPDDLAYENSAAKRCEKLGVRVRSFILPQSARQEELIELIEDINGDSGIHGCLILRPLPAQFDDEAIRAALSFKKDVDGITDDSLSGVFTGTGKGFPPATAAACMEILDHFGIGLEGKRAVVIGRSLVVGKPVAMMLLQRHATVTVCHTRTRNMPELCRQADVLIVAAGKAGIVGREYFSPGQTVIDVGINVDKDGNMSGDAVYEEAEQIVEAVTPVPGGVGLVTTSVLIKHVIEAAERVAAS